jgi:hypothetical protein
VVEFNAGVTAARFEGGADAAIALDFLVLVVGAGGLGAHGVEERTEGAAQGAGLAGQCDLVAPHAHGDGVFGHDAVIVAVTVHTGAQVAGVPYPGSTQRTAAGPAGRIDQPRALLTGAVFQRPAEGGHAQVVAAATEGVGMCVVEAQAGCVDQLVYQLADG